MGERMSNAFDSANYPEGIPDVLVVGDRWLWKRTDLGNDYAPDSYSLQYVLRRQGATDEIVLTANESGSDYLIESASTATTLHAPGEYQYQVHVLRTSDSERITVERGTVDVRPNRDDALSGDPRSHAKRMLDAIEAVLEGTATTDQQSYSVSTGTGSRSLTRTPRDELLRLRGWYRHEYRNELSRERVARGLASQRTVQMRFIA